MSMMDDMPRLMNERYNLMMRRERWRGIADGATLCNTVLMAASLANAATGGPSMSWWHIMVAPAMAALGIWRWHCIVKRIDAMDASMREAVKAATPAAAPKEKMVN